MKMYGKRHVKRDPRPVEVRKRGSRRILTMPGPGVPVRVVKPASPGYHIPDQLSDAYLKNRFRDHEGDPGEHSTDAC